MDGEGERPAGAESGTWLQNDWSGKGLGHFARTRPVKTGLLQNTQDLGRDLQSTFTLWPASAVSVNTDLAYRDYRIQAPDDTGKVSQRRNANTDLSGSLRMRLDNDRSLGVTGGLSRSFVTLGTSSGSSETRATNLQVEARARLLGAALEARFRLGGTRTETPLLDTIGGYGEKSEDRGLEALATRQFLHQRLSARATGRLSLQRQRYYTIGRYSSLPVPRDVAAQSYRLECTYTMSREFNTTADST